MSIQNELDKIASINQAIKGSEVRLAIHDALMKVYDDAAKSGNANMEVSLARGNYPTLRERLQEVDNKQQQTTSQLAQKVGKGVKAGLEDLSDTVISAIEGGEGTSFDLLSIPQNHSVTPKKTTFVEDYNVFNPENSLRGGFWQTAGGTWQARAGLSQSEKYLYNTGDTIIFNRLSAPYGNAVIQFWDENGAYLGNGPRPLSIKISVVSPNAKQFSFAYYDQEESELEVYVNEVKRPMLTGVDITRSLEEADAQSLINNPWKGKTVIYQGDSITDPIYNSNLSTRWTEVLNENLGLEEIANYAISGSTFAVNPDNPTARNPIVNRLDSMVVGADLIITAAITNDWFYSWSPIGTMDSREPTTLYGALHLTCLHHKQKYPNSTIVFFNGIKRNQGISTSPLSTNAHGKTLDEYNKIMKEVCEYYSIRTFDMNVSSGLYPFENTLALLDYIDQGYFTHPNASGQLKMGKAATGFIKTIEP